MKGIFKVKFLILAIALLLLTVAGNCLALENIKIGVVGAGSAGQSNMHNAVELLVKDINGNGGVLGRQVELIVETDPCDPEKKTDTAATLVSHQVDAVVGHFCTDSNNDSLKIYKDADLVVVSSSGTGTSFAKSGGYPLFFKTVAPGDVQAARQIRLLKKYLKINKTALIYAESDYGKGLAQSTKTLMDRDSSIDLVMYKEITAGADDYSSVIEGIKTSGAGAVVFAGNYPEAIQIVTQMRKNSIDAFFIAGDAVKDEAFINDGRLFVEGVHVTAPKDLMSDPLAIKAIADYKKTYGKDPGASFLNDYAAIQVLLSGIEKAGSSKAESLSMALRSNRVETVLGKIYFDEKGDPVGLGTSLFQVRSKKFVQVN